MIDQEAEIKRATKDLVFEMRNGQPWVTERASGMGWAFEIETDAAGRRRLGVASPWSWGSLPAGGVPDEVRAFAEGEAERASVIDP